MEFVPFQPMVSQSNFKSHSVTFLVIGFLTFVAFLM